MRGRDFNARRCPCFGAVINLILMVTAFFSSAPNAYKPDKPTFSPEFSFGVKTPAEKPSDTPGKSLIITI